MPKIGPGERFKIASAVVAIAATHDMRPIRLWHDAFLATNNRFLDAQQQVEAQEKILSKARRQLAERRHGLHDRLRRLGVALMLDGHPRMNPLRHLKVTSPAALERQAMRTKVRTVHELAANIHRHPGLSAGTRRLADECAAAASALVSAAAAVVEAQSALHYAISAREAVGMRWNADLKSLRLAAAAHDRRLATLLRFGERRRRHSARQDSGAAGD